jgi:hypothetical protein
MNESYRTYKKYTDVFLSWIQRAFRFLSEDDYLDQSSTVGSIRNKVDVIVDSEFDDFFFESKIWKEVPKILKAGTNAIKLRKEINSLYTKCERKKNDPEYQKENRNHVKFIKFLEDLHERLQGWHKKIFHRSVKEIVRVHFTSMFDVPSESPDEVSYVSTELPVPMETEDEEDDEDINSLTLEDLDFSFGNLRFSIICILLEIREASDKITDAWKRVKKQSLSFHSAVMVTFLAMKEIQKADLELRATYSSVETIRDFLSAMNGFLEQDKKEKIEGYEFYRGLFAAASAISSFESILPKDNKPLAERTMWFPRTDNFFGVPYSEQFTGPLKTDISDAIRFFSREVPYLYNSYLLHYNSKGINDPRSSPKRTKNMKITSVFLDQFDAFFVEVKNTLSLSFVAYCWMKIVQILEDKSTLFMAKSVYLMRHFSRKLNSNYETSNFLQILKRLQISPEDPCVLKLVEGRMNPFSQLFIGPYEYKVFYNNPFLCGAVMLDMKINDYHACTQFMDKFTNYHRGIAHLYIALVRECYLSDKITALENFQEIFVNIFFRINYDHGHLTNYFNSSAKGTTAEATVPSLVKIILSDDYSRFHEYGMSLGDALMTMEELTTFEMFSDRILSVDLLKYFVHFFKLFEELKIKMPEIQQQFQAYYNSPEYQTGHSETYRYAMASEHATVMQALTLFELPKASRTSSMKQLLQDICTNLKSFFGKLKAETEFFIYPKNSSGLYMKEFGDLRLGSSYPDQLLGQAPELWGQCMDMLEAVETRLKDKEKQQLFAEIKALTKKCPSLLLKGDPFATYPTILDHVICNARLSDEEFSEWILAMGGNVSKTNRISIPDPSLSHLQLAARFQNPQGLKLLLTADKLIDNLNYQCFDDGNTVLHYAAITQNRLTIELLLLEGVDTSIRNQQNQLAVDLLPASNGYLIQRLSQRSTEFAREKQDFIADDLEDGTFKRTMQAWKEGQRKEEKTIEKLKKESFEDAFKSALQNKTQKKQSVEREITKEDQKKAREAEKRLKKL